jgi:cytochrome c oxidase cbb3-type subunit III
MSSLMIKALAFAAVLIGATLAVVKSMNVNLDDPINQLTLLGAVAIATLTFGVSAKYINQMKTDKAEGQLADDNWDGIGEYKNELPAGWAYSYLGTLIWAVWYFMVGYPLNAYSSIGEYNEEVIAYNTKFEEIHKNADENTLNEMGQSIFLVQCAPCHGEVADGIGGRAQNLQNRISKEQVMHSIQHGQNQLGYPMGAMPAGLLQGADAEAVAEYVANGMQGDAPAAYGVCAGCHGMDGKGMGGMSPNLVEYDAKLMQQVLQNGKKGSIGMMPSFKGRLTPVQEKALTNYLNTL